MTTCRRPRRLSLASATVLLGLLGASAAGAEVSAPYLVANLNDRPVAPLLHPRISFPSETTGWRST